MIEICVKCKLSYTTKEQGVTVEEFANFGSYKLWEADLKECPNCKHQIISGFAKENFAEHYHNDYKEKLQRIKTEGILYEWKENVK